MRPGPTAASDLIAPSLRRRMACFVYEGVLLFGVLMLAGYLYATVTQQRHAMRGHAGLQVFLFTVLGGYFVWLWSHGGQTLAMKTWRIKLLCSNGQPVSLGRAVWRYVGSWAWFLPALALAYLAGWRSAPMIGLALLTGLCAYVALAALHPSRQFLHDRLCGTRIVPALP